MFDMLQPWKKHVKNALFMDAVMWMLMNPVKRRQPAL